MKKLSLKVPNNKLISGKMGNMIFANSDLENELWTKGYQFVCGVDEVGKGCFAGPVVAGAVIFNSGSRIPAGIADSKLLTPKKREILAKEIKQAAAFCAVGEVEVEIINQVGIAQATQMAFKRAIDNLDNFPDFILIDAFLIKDIDKKMQQAIIGGDRISVSIAAASIIAKVYRDDLMVKLHEQFPHYDFATNKGYGTKVHREAITVHGLCDLHRKCFDLQKFMSV